MNDIRTFNDLLLKARLRMGKTAKKLADENGISVGVVAGWERHTTHFPLEEKLPVIAKVYGITLDQLREAWNTSRQALLAEKTFPKVNKKLSDDTGKSEKDLFSGKISSRKEIFRMNDPYGMRHH